LKQKIAMQQEGAYGNLDKTARDMYRMDLTNQMAKANAKYKMAKLKSDASGEGMRKLGADDIKRLGYITSMQSNLGNVATFITQNPNYSTISTVAKLKSGMLGDDDLSIALRNTAESYGRMQSGGAINKEEETRFLASLLKAGDSEQAVRAKIQDKMQEVNDRESQLYYGANWRDHVKKENAFGGGKNAPKTGVNSDAFKAALAQKRAEAGRTN